MACRKISWTARAPAAIVGIMMYAIVTAGAVLLGLAG